jgi:murein L,D-transpeptidase YcbB/YkuD
MNRIVYAGLLGLALIAGCDNHGGRSGQGAPAVDAADLKAAADPQAKAFYEARDWAPAWTRGDERALKAAIDRRSEHGLERLAFWPDLAGRSPAQREALLTRTALRYADALARGAADPEKLYDVYELKRPEANAAAGLQQALAGGDLAGWLERLAPQDDGYKALSQAYLRQRDAAAPDTGPIVPGEPLKPGAGDDRVPQVRAALADAGYLPAARAGAQDKVYGPDLAAAVKALQANFGIEADGVIGPATLDVLNMGPADRAQALAVAMERLRWLARDPAPDRIDVNTATAELTYYRGGQVADRRKVVTGQPGKETPQLESPIYRLVANPTWTVPRSIEPEIIGKGEAHMSRSGIGWKDGRLVQQPGPTNSLGLVKFDMRNDHAIYLHDTPAKALFGSHQRQLSHGCVRVEDALGFADEVAGDEGVQAKWAEARQRQDETFVALPREIPVRLMYRTAFAAEGGIIRYTTDPYGWDDKIAQALGFAETERSRFRTDVNDAGP